MDNIRIIQALCRIGLASAGPAFRFQVERLSKALRSAQDKDAACLEELLKSQETENSLRPSRIIQSSSAELPGELLSPRVTAPVDKETGAPLAEILFPSDDCPLPIFNEQLTGAIERVIQEWGHVDQLEAIGAAPPLTCMLFGKPGTGKTRLAHYISSRLGVPMVLARLDGLISSFLGTTARNMGALFDFVNRYKCLLLLDEFDALAKLRDDPQEVGEIKRVVNTLLQNIDKRAISGFTIAITNHESLLDPAVWRRFEIRIEVPVPSEIERKQILERYLQPLPIDEVELMFLIWISDGLTGSDLETMSKSIKRFTTIHGRGDFSLIDALRAYALTNATAEQGGARLRLLLAPLQEIARQLLVTPEIGLKQHDVGVLLGKDQATISRWKKADLTSPEKAVVHGE